MMMMIIIIIIITLVSKKLSSAYLAMASSLLRRTRAVVPFRPTSAISVSATTRQHSPNTTQTRPFSSKPTFEFDLAFLAHQMKIMSRAPSMLLTLVNGEELTVDIPGMERTETDDGPCLTLQLPGLRAPKGQYQAVAHNTVVEDNNLLMYFQTGKETYLAGLKLPDNIDPAGRMNGLISKGTMRVTLPYLKNTDFVHSPVKIARPTPYCDAFDRSVLGKRLCETIAYSGVKSKSFTAYKKDTGESIYIKGNLPGVENSVVNKEGLCVSLNMPGFELEDVESGFEYDSLIIEGKRGNEHYIAGVRLLEGFKRENDVIKREMQDGLYKVTLPHADVNRLAFRAYR